LPKNEISHTGVQLTVDSLPPAKSISADLSQIENNSALKYLFELLGKYESIDHQILTLIKNGYYHKYIVNRPSGDYLGEIREMEFLSKQQIKVPSNHSVFHSGIT